MTKIKKFINDFINFEDLSENDSRLSTYLANSMQEGLSKDIKIQILFNFRIIVEYFVEKKWSIMPIAIQQNNKSFYGKDKTQGKNLGSILKQLKTYKSENKQQQIFSSDSLTEKEIMNCIDECIPFYLNDGAHYNETNAILKNAMRTEDIDFIVKSSIILLNCSLRKEFFIDQSLLDEIENFIKNKNFFQQQTYINQGGYFNTAKFDILKFKESQDSLSIPFYQRPYVWGKEEITTFLNSDESYKGSLTIRLNNKIWSIIDGQQRLTTVIIAMETIFPEKMISISNTISYNSMFNDLSLDTKKIEETKKIIREIYDSKNDIGKKVIENNLLNSYFILVDIESDTTEIANFKYMNIASKSFTIAEQNRTKIISNLFGEFNNHKDVDQYISDIEKNIYDIAQKQSYFFLYWYSLGYLIEEDSISKILEAHFQKFFKNIFNLYWLELYLNNNQKNDLYREGNFFFNDIFHRSNFYFFNLMKIIVKEDFSEGKMALILIDFIVSRWDWMINISSKKNNNLTLNEILGIKEGISSNFETALKSKINSKAKKLIVKISETLSSKEKIEKLFSNSPMLSFERDFQTLVLIIELLYKKAEIPFNKERILDSFFRINNEQLFNDVEDAIYFEEEEFTKELLFEKENLFFDIRDTLLKESGVSNWDELTKRISEIIKDI